MRASPLLLPPSLAPGLPLSLLLSLAPSLPLGLCLQGADRLEQMVPDQAKRLMQVRPPLFAGATRVAQCAAGRRCQPYGL